MATTALVKWDLTVDEFNAICDNIDTTIFPHAEDWVRSIGLEVTFKTNLYGTLSGTEEQINWLKLHL
jgi:hypothetical protein